MKENLPFTYSQKIKQRKKNVWNCNFHLALFFESFLSAREKLWWTQQVEEIVDLMCCELSRNVCDAIDGKIVAFNLFYVDSITKENFF